MVASELDPKMFIFRPMPLPGESFSSWRQRIALANGYRLFQRMRGEEFDHDRPSSVAVKAVCQTVGLAPEETQGLSLQSYQGVISKPSKRVESHPRWQLILRRSDISRATPSTCCTSCLKTDATPYYRSIWRLAFVNECSIHGCNLIDCCPCCGEALWPGTVTKIAYYQERQLPLWECARCHFDLRQTSVEPVSIEICKRVTGALQRNSIRLNETFTISSCDYFDAVASICHLFLRQRTRELIHRSPWNAAVSFETRKGDVIEKLSLPIRQMLVTFSCTLLDEWPNRFLHFVRTVGLRPRDLTGLTMHSPQWMTTSEIRDRWLRPLGQGMTSNNLVSASNALGIAKHSAAVSQKRSDATVEEFWEFLDEVKGESATTVIDVNKRHLRVRDTLIVLFLLRSDYAFQILADMGPEVVSIELRWATYHSDQRIRELSRAVLESLWRALPEANRRTPLRSLGGRAPGRAPIHKLVARCMQHLDADLPRDISTFRRVVHELTDGMAASRAKLLASTTGI